MTVKQPMELRILVEPYEDEEKTTETGIVAELKVHIKATRPKKGKVFMVGDECKEAIHPDVEVLYDRSEYPIINSDGKDYELIRQSNVICLIQ